MNNDAPDRRRRGYEMRRSVLDYGMGIMIFGFGIFFLLAPRWGFEFSVDDTMRNIFSGLCIVYGGWRCYRGYARKYFK